MLGYPTKAFFSFLSNNKVMNRAAKKWGLRLGAAQVVAGKTMDEAIGVIIKLNSEGLACTVDHLGEFVMDKKEAIEATDACILMIKKIAEAKADCNISLKLTKLGLDIDEDFCYENMRLIVASAQQYGNFVRIDMEDFGHLEQTLAILKKLRSEFNNVSTVIQAYLYRSQNDLEELKGYPLRLVKGAYNESKKVAFQTKGQIDKNYMKLIKKHMLSGSYTAVATHDHRVIEKVKKYASLYHIPQSKFEFQFLYGFRTNLQKELIMQGYRVRVYVPYGEEWFGYFMRRLAERPQNVSFAIKGFFSK